MATIGETIVNLVKQGIVCDATLVTTMGEVRVAQSILGNTLVMLGDDVFDEEFPEIFDDEILTVSMIACEGKSIPRVHFKFDNVPYPEYM